MVEFVMVLPILALLLVMAVDFGRVFFGWVALQNASRIAADFAANHPDAWPSDATDRARYQAVVTGDLEAINCDRPPGPVPDPTFPSGKETGDPAIVHLDCTFPLITPLAQSVLGGPVPVSAESIFPVNRTIQQGLPPNAAPDPPPPDEEEEEEPPPDECGTPLAEFTWSPTDARKNQPVAFTDTSSVGTCTVTAWSWDLDHGTGSSQQNPTHTYTWNGNSTKHFDVTLTITTSGGVDSVTHTVTARP
jgi:hypothetical protein